MSNFLRAVPKACELEISTSDWVSLFSKDFLAMESRSVLDMTVDGRWRHKKVNDVAQSNLCPLSERWVVGGRLKRESENGPSFLPPALNSNRSFLFWSISQGHAWSYNSIIGYEHNQREPNNAYSPTTPTIPRSSNLQKNEPIVQGVFDIQRM